MPKWSFDDNYLGRLSGDSIRSLRSIPRPPGVTKQHWYTFCEMLLEALNEDPPLIPIIARVAGDNARLEARVTELLTTTTVLVEARRAVSQRLRQVESDLNLARIEIKQLEADRSIDLPFTDSIGA